MKNAKLFILFRCLFNSRFYYPVFTVLFLDHGLSLENFALLNSLWAFSIVVLEVPSGALADIIGRKNLVVAAAFITFIEMLVLLVVPPSSAWVFWAFALNRILSGMAEAAASGADEALAYDSLPEENREGLWSELYAKTMRWQSGCFLFTMLFGAFVYDHEKVTTLLGWLGYHSELSRIWTLKAPIALCVLSAILTVIVALKMEEVSEEESEFELSKCVSLGKDAFRTTVEAGVWILKSKNIFSVIAIGLCLDAIIRLFLTINSEYYRSVGVDPAYFGVIGAAAAGMGLWVPAVGRKMAGVLSRTSVAIFLCVLCTLSFWGLQYRFNLSGLVFIVPLFMTMHLLGYFMSLYLNKDASPKMRATILSFKGLSFNLAYGFVGIGYSWLVAKNSDTYGKELAFEKSLESFYPVFLVSIGVAIVFIIVQKKVSRT